MARIRVDYHLKTAAGNRDTAEHVHGFHAQFCPMARTLADCVEITTRLNFEE